MAPVVIVGGGPVGLLTALLLARFEVPTIILEQRPTGDREGSKAICFQRDVLDIFDRVGIADVACAEGVTWRIARTTYRDEELFHIELPDSGDGSLPPFINLSQSRLEMLLEEEVARSPLVDLRRGHTVVGLTRGLGDGDVGVRVTVDTNTRRMDLEGSHVIGADGARSTVRHMMGATFEGHSFDEQFLIADIEADLGFAAERRFHFDPSWNPGRQVLVHQQPHGIWRIDWQVPAEFDLVAEREAGELDRRIRLITGDREYRIDWLSVYRFHQRLASTFARGRVFLVGDAAHLMAPFGARGLNSGAQDAENLAWKLAWHLRGWGGEDLLPSYEIERRAAAEENLRVTDETMRFLVPQDDAGRAERQRILQAAVTDPQARALVNSGKLAEPHRYAESPLTTSAERTRGTVPSGESAGVPDPGGQASGGLASGGLASGGLTPGGLCRDHPLVGAGHSSAGPVRLRQHFGRSTTVLVLGGLGRGDTPPGCGPIAWLDIDELDGFTAAAGVPPRCHVVIRPDGHVAAITTEKELTAQAIRRAVGNRP